KSPPAYGYNVERNLVALADFAQDVSDRHGDVLEIERGRGRAADAHFVFFGARRNTRKGPLDNKGRELLTVHFREDYIHIGNTAIGNPHLGAIQDVEPPVGAE